MYDNFGQFINGRWRAGTGSESLTVVDPGNGRALGHLQASSREDTLEALNSADRAFAGWKNTPAWQRADLLQAVARAMTAAAPAAAVTISKESGKPLAQAKREWELAVDQFIWHAEEARRIYGRIIESRVPGGRCEVLHEPVGVVAAFTAWNFPVVLVARKLAPALAAGCTVVLRPSSEVPGSAMLIFECLRQAGLPAGVANLVVGPTATTYDPLMASPRVKKVSLTGSTQIGQRMIRDAAATVKRLSMELGGNAPVVVFGDADLEKALDLSVATKFANCGQVCVTGDRFYVHQSLYPAFVDGFARRASQLKVGYGLDDDTGMGPLINPKRLQAIENIVEDARSRGGKIVTGGHRLDVNGGYFYAPTVIADLPDDALAMAEENFGPIAAITAFSDTESLWQRVNNSSFALSAYAFTRDPALIRESVSRLESGMVGINSYALAAAEAPFGGIKASGMGREGGSEGIHDYMNIKLAQIVV
ncbi:NAD-dependent succinate-semialdehyde dehydrogenase [Serratia ficaria]|uniref:NAD-dependent succinate-semialdehyde dehydrogenase n=1 Tax=Serratia ficaria TaxID=61651 RepID=UPI00077CDB24|nr:NAD-dependent succinate-semialdehyde dehydrogenase [Serratia ficaria]CAI0802441.1 Succinate-semialdehyde dehydrogenase [NADP(+)] GabD [Serratia ficaria]CAI1666629.1 Succinate-semialdehyde dehydrogenase [NADP(+)] GabD [Serratia ficaria]CAI1667076.1 Succinate-semialdehyde dehydrogenase [NADP(+)] GabD [Serratia ficaria]CAI2433453.1 Succinate-semialdehyde dehydrogenase [NADP(+)] GabD [Serratia ficaria]CAI2507558.1 Succinate-semialdehyde dehydrogenase [NADP(+)] GabD [Serratia ficaria]